MVDSVFPVYSFDRNKIKWEDYLKEIVPVQRVEQDGRSMQFKRGDYFAPLGYGGINGDKLRTALWLYSEHVKAHGAGLAVHGALLGSPQTALMSSLGKHYGSKVVTVAFTSEKTALKHEAVQFGSTLGSEFALAASGYKTVLHKKCYDIKAGRPEVFHLETGTSVCHKKNDPQLVADFHEISSWQVDNIPDDVEDLIIPFGGSNSSIGIFMGLCRNLPKSLKRVHLLGIGPDKTGWFLERLGVIRDNLPHKYGKLLDFTLNGIQQGVSDSESSLWGSASKPESRFEVTYTPLTHLWQYKDLVQHSFGGITFHPRYEAKAFRYLEETLPHLIKPTSLFWIVGSEPTLEAVKSNVTDEAFPETPVFKLYEET